MKKRSGILIGTILLLISVIPSGLSAPLSEEEPYIAVIEKNEEYILFADHNESETEGNWILLSGGKAIKLPEPFTFTYNGINRIDYAGGSLELNVENNTDHVITYPYSNHSFYTADESVEMDFKGSSTFKDQEVEIYLVDMRGTNLGSISDAYKAIKEESPDSFGDIFNDTVNSKTQVAAETLDENGDLPAPLDLGTQPEGLHGVLVLLNDSSEDQKVLSMTCFEVLEYELGTEAPESLDEGENLEISLALENVTETDTLTYGAVLVKASAYYADIRLNSNGTWDETDVIINDVDIIEEFDINSSNLESKFGRDELQTEIQTLIGEGNGTITIGEENESNLSLTAFDLAPGDYLLFAGAYEKDKGIVGIDQKELTIVSSEGVGSSSDSSGSSSFSSSSSSSFSSSSSSEAADSRANAVEEASTLREAPSVLEEETEAAYSEGKGIAAEVPKKGISKEMGFFMGFAGMLVIGIAMIKRKG